MALRTNLKINRGRARTVLLALAAASASMAGGCRGRGAADAETVRRPAASVSVPARAAAAGGRAPASGAPGAFALLGGTPPGGLREWIGDVRRGLAGIPTQAVRDPAGAQGKALELYLTR